MARPRKGEELGAVAAISLRVPLGLRERLEALADQHGRSITDEVRHALEVYANAARLA